MLFRRDEEARGYYLPLMSPEIAAQVAELHNQTVAEGDEGACWLVFDGVDLHVTSCTYDPDSSHILEPDEHGLYDLSDWPWERPEWQNDADGTPWLCVGSAGPKAAGGRSPGSSQPPSSDPKVSENATLSGLFSLICS